MDDDEFYEDKGSWLKSLQVANLSPGVSKNSVVLLEPVRVDKSIDDEVMKRRNYLLQTFRLPLTDQRQLATAVSKIEGLKDVEGKKDLSEKIWNGRKVAKNRKKTAQTPTKDIGIGGNYLNESSESGSGLESQEDEGGKKGSQGGKKGGENDTGGGDEDVDSDATDDEDADG